jgi:hypothetical protein
MNYRIYHPTGGVINYRGRQDVYSWEYVADVVAESLPEAFKRADNKYEDYQLCEVRSTKPGDLIGFTEDGHVYLYIIRSNKTFDQVPNTILDKLDASMIDDFIYND